MKKNRSFHTILTIGCVLLLSTGCGDAGRQAPPASDEASAAKPSAQSDPTGEVPTYITLAEAKSTVLENAGLSEENVEFIRTQLDTDHDAASYDIKFLYENTEYDYTVHAVTGEILSMNCETASYDAAAASPEDAQPAEASSDASLQPDTNPQQTGDRAAQNSAGGDNRQNTAGTEQYIGTEAAKQAALDHAGLNESDVNFVHTHLESDDGYWKYDIEFYKDHTEYDYDIDALSGEILSYDHDAEYSQPKTISSPDAEKITEDRAKEIALSHAGIAEKDAQRLKVKLDYDDGRAEYEIEWQVGRTEYSCDIDAYTGEVLSFEKELD